MTLTESSSGPPGSRASSLESSGEEARADAARLSMIRDRVVRSRRRAVLADRCMRLAGPALSAVILALLWERWSASAESIMVASATKTLRAFFEETTSGLLWSAAATTAESILIGYAISTIVGVAVGIAMAQSKRLERVADVYISIVLVTPTAVLIPVLIMATGISLTTRVIVVMIFSLPYVISNSRAGVKNVDTSLIEMARCFGATRRQAWGKIIIPGAAPGIVTGLRLALAQAINGAIVVELILVPVGVGGLILDHRGAFRADHLYATVLFVVLASLVLLNALKLAEKAVFGWAATHGDRLE